MKVNVKATKPNKPTPTRRYVARAYDWEQSIPTPSSNMKSRVRSCSELFATIRLKARGDCRASTLPLCFVYPTTIIVFRLFIYRIYISVSLICINLFDSIYLDTIENYFI